MANHAKTQSNADPHVPPGWSANPSGWSQRLPIVALSTAGFGIAAYLAAYQWGLMPKVWEPFFGQGSNAILTSSASTVPSIPVAVLGASGYLLGAVAGLIGDRARWRRMPWVVILLGLAIGPLGAASVLFVILQPVAFGTWCTLCLASATLSLAMVGPAMDEVLASLQYLRRAKGMGHSAWLAFWGAEPLRESGASGQPMGRNEVWPQLVNLALGLWLMAAPDVLGYAGLARTLDRILGPLIAGFALVAVWEVTRPLRRANLLLGGLLVVIPWAFGYSEVSTINDFVVGSFVSALSLWGGGTAQRFGGGWSSLMPARYFAERELPPPSPPGADRA